MKKIKCLICGREFIKPLAHVWQKHEMTAREYKKEFGFDLKKGIIPEEHKQYLREIIDHKSIENLKKGEQFRFKKGDKNAGKYERSKQTMERLHNLSKLSPIKPKNRIIIHCFTCGKEKEIVPSQLKEKNFCSRHCSTINRNKLQKSNK